jgi:TPR repeat protein
LTVFCNQQIQNKQALRHGGPFGRTFVVDLNRRGRYARSPSAVVVSRQLDRDQLVSMLRRADEFIKTGDLSSARLLLRRAAEAGDGQAALTLAGTFDPSVLAALRLQDGAADVAMARLWYECAEQFGSSEAPRRLREIATDPVKRR